MGPWIPCGAARADTRPRRVWLRVALAPVDGLARRLANHGQTAGTPEGRGPSGVYDANVAPLPDLILYARPACSLCDEARQAIDLVIADRRDRGLPVPNVIERDIDADPDLHRALMERIPVVELGDQRVELIVSIGKVRRLMNEVLGAEPAGDPAAESHEDPTEA